METTALDPKSLANPKGGLALLMKALAKLSKQTVQPGRESLFAGMLGQKISQTTLSASTSDSVTATPGGKHPLAVAMKGMILNGEGQSATGRKANRTTDHHPQPQACNKEPVNGIACETNSLAGPAGKKPLSLIGKKESTEETKTLSLGTKVMMEQAPAIPVNGESTPHADQSPTGSATRQIAPSDEPDAASFELANTTPSRKSDRSATGSAPEKNPTAGSPAAPITAASHGFRPLFDRHADHHSLPEGAERQAEQPFAPRPNADEILQMKRERPTTEAAPPKKPATTAAEASTASEKTVSYKNLTTVPPAAPATPALHELRPLSDLHADDRPLPEGAVRRIEQPFAPKPAVEEILQMKNDRPKTEVVFTGKPAILAAATPAASAEPVSYKNMTTASQEPRPLSDHHADDRPLPEGAEHRTAQRFMPRPMANETQQMKNSGPTADVVFTGKPATTLAAAPAASEEAVSYKNLTAASPAASTAPAPHEFRSLSNRHDDSRSPLERAEHRTEQPFAPKPNVNETQQVKNDGRTKDVAPLDIRQAGPSRHNGGNRTLELIGTASQKPVSTGNGVGMIGHATFERMTPEKSADPILPTINVVTETPGTARNHQENRNKIPNYQAKLSERDIFPFRMEMPNPVSPQGTHTPASVSSAGIEMQALIDQLVETRQSAGNDFGRIRIMLNPPNLGSVDLDIVVRGERVDVVLTTENATAQQALQSRGEDIRIALQRQDYRIEGFQVLLQENGTGQQQTYNGEMYRQNRGQREHLSAEVDLPVAFPILSTNTGVIPAAGRISIFA